AAGAEETFAMALELPEAERSKFLEQRCGSDASLRAEIESLLKWHALAEVEHWEIPSDAEGQAAPVLRHMRARTLAFRQFGIFDLKEYLGEGVSGIVYRAVDTRDGQQVALKIASPHTMLDTANRSRFQSAARAAQALNHLNIARILEIGEFDDLCYI